MTRMRPKEDLRKGLWIPDGTCRICGDPVCPPSTTLCGTHVESCANRPFRAHRYRVRQAAIQHAYRSIGEQKAAEYCAKMWEKK